MARKVYDEEARIDVEETALDKAVREVNLPEDTEEEVYQLLAGYTDSEGTLHTEFTLREMTGRDEEAINKADVRGNGPRIASILLSRCVTRIGSLTPKSVGQAKWLQIIKDLYAGDQDYMMLMLRKISLGDTIELVNECPSCHTRLETHIGVDEVEIEEFKGERLIHFELPRGYRDRKGVLHRTGTMRLSTGLDREILIPLAKTNPSKAETTMLTRLCKFDDGMPIDEDVMASLVVKDRRYLQELMRDNLFGLKTEVEITCTTCGEVFTGSMNSSNFI